MVKFWPSLRPVTGAALSRLVPVLALAHVAVAPGVASAMPPHDWFLTGLVTVAVLPKHLVIVLSFTNECSPRTAAVRLPSWARRWTMSMNVLPTFRIPTPEMWLVITVVVTVMTKKMASCRYINVVEK
jgi:hypothetical protein